ncbi:MAG: DUF4412 domain-containing protein [Bacteroidia bacterium]|nr:DUF4412 domain-containing protein [Bacteroidia bacterium]
MIRTVSLNLLLIGAWVYGQKSFEGSLTFTTKLEGAMASQMEEMLKGQLPERMITYYRGNKSRSEVGDMTIIVDGDAGYIYALNPALQSYQRSPIQPPQQDQPQPKITRTKEKTKILGQSVEKYMVEVPTDQGTVKMEIWAAPSLKVSETLGRTNALTRGAKVEGLPLRISMDVPGMDLKIIFLATQISQTPPDEALFRIPEGYVEDKSGGSDE